MNCAEKKDRSKFRGEDFDHVEGFFKILKDVEKGNPRILSDGDRVWSMDETSISCEFGKEPKYLALHKLIRVGSLHHQPGVDPGRM